MFAVVRTGGKQYRVHPGDKIVVEKLDGNAGDQITLGDVLLAGEAVDLKSTNGLTVAAEIVAQAKGDKVTVFKKRRRHNYRRKQGHRQQHTILQDRRDRRPQAVPRKPRGPRKGAQGRGGAQGRADKGSQKPAARAKETAEVEAAQHEAGEIVGTPTENPAPDARRSGEAREARGEEGRRGQGQGAKSVDRKCCTC